MKSLLLLCALLPVISSAQSAQTDIPVHDPVMIRQDSVYYVYSTGRGINVWSSADRKQWKREHPVFDSLPWGRQAVPGFTNHIWAPDISYYHGLYYLYYSVSAFGKNTSCIGVATNTTLHPADSAYHWTDHGKVIESVPGRDLWNAIDPNLVIDEQEQPWLVFGSFWNGIKMVKLAADRLSIASPQEWFTVAARTRDALLPDSMPGNGAIEAPFIFRKNGYYYLFTSFDHCCRGEKSTYKIMVGRSAKATGPYTDQAGVPLAKGGGTLVLAGDTRWHGVGHNAVCTFDGTDYLVFHAYDATDAGRSRLRMEKIRWNEAGWPVIE